MKWSVGTREDLMIGQGQTDFGLGLGKFQVGSVTPRLTLASVTLESLNLVKMAFKWEKAQVPRNLHDISVTLGILLAHTHRGAEKGEAEAFEKCFVVDQLMAYNDRQTAVLISRARGWAASNARCQRRGMKNGESTFYKFNLSLFLSSPWNNSCGNWQARKAIHNGNRERRWRQCRP